jgi:hypothetical protein
VLKFRFVTRLGTLASSRVREPTPTTRNDIIPVHANTSSISSTEHLHVFHSSTSEVTCIVSILLITANVGTGAIEQYQVSRRVRDLAVGYLVS